jgi:hypothetical protein
MGWDEHMGSIRFKKSTMGFNGRYNYYKSPIIMGKTLGLQEIGA